MLVLLIGVVVFLSAGALLIGCRKQKQAPAAATTLLNDSSQKSAYAWIKKSKKRSEKAPAGSSSLQSGNPANERDVDRTQDESRRQVREKGLSKRDVGDKKLQKTKTIATNETKKSLSINEGSEEKKYATNPTIQSGRSSNTQPESPHDIPVK